MVEAIYPVGAVIDQEYSISTGLFVVKFELKLGGTTFYVPVNQYD
ncbi:MULTISPECIES: hypothetical protein [Leuconostoc]|uniref:Uncharacterized protein n=1 Tax=Leuconostoc kimchii (strain IMSNU 11154 / KCTC 2386 / IH25) TaxID=762051 RepID=D5T2C4_LEUKI|nr:MULTISPECIES: hypothetical protein [Leuconostoc]ADG40423.1 hypothetical protein LKI_04405 [Leuconostoc kimchii IMSNU 11154]AEJ31653.1 hypothetical protein LGMK_08020 [Leuconostoc sp. C2]